MRHTRLLAPILVALLALLMMAGPTLAGPPLPRMVNSYYSPRLKANLYLQQMSIPGHVFWGARIVGTDWNSPLHSLNVQLGDVVTRLDGISVATGKYWDSGGYWALPQIEKHYSSTQIRYVRSGTTSVYNGWVDLGPLSPTVIPPPPVPPTVPPVAP